jgi:hypothetical protein
MTGKHFAVSWQQAWQQYRGGGKVARGKRLTQCWLAQTQLQIFGAAQNIYFSFCRCSAEDVP